MRLVVIGTQERQDALTAVALKCGCDCLRIKSQAELTSWDGEADAAALPWPRALSDGRVAGTDIALSGLAKRLSGCGAVVCSAADARALGLQGAVIDPTEDEAFLEQNAKLTAEGALQAMLCARGALIGRTALITGFGRIGRAMTRRLCALEMFVIVCARHEGQMRAAHEMGAHPVPLDGLSAACAQADVIVNTVPARIFSAQALEGMKRGVRFLELASAPYGADPQAAQDAGVSMEIMAGIPGKYAPQEAGEALFGAIHRAMERIQRAEEA